MYSYGPPHMAKQKQDAQLEHTYSSSVRIQDVALKTCQRQWTIGRSGERGSGISVLVARHDEVYSIPESLGICIHCIYLHFSCSFLRALFYGTWSYWIQIFLNRSIWPIDGTLKSIITPDQSGPGSNGNEEVLLTSQISKNGSSTSDNFISYQGHPFFVGVYYPSARDTDKHILS